MKLFYNGLMFGEALAAEKYCVIGEVLILPIPPFVITISPL
jgi:hypothetical protein